MKFYALLPFAVFALAPSLSLANLITHGDFEVAPFADGWTASEVTATSGLDGSATAVPLGWATHASRKPSCQQ